MPVARTTDAPTKGRKPVMSAPGVELSRDFAWSYRICNVTPELEELFLSHAGAARFAFNQGLGWVKTTLEWRWWETDVLGIEAVTDVPWSAFSLITYMNTWKDGRHPHAPTWTAVDADTGEVTEGRGLAWHREVSADVFECAMVDLAQALDNWKTSRNGTRKGRAVGFPRFKSKHKTAPSFRLRNRAAPGKTQAIRFTDPHTLKVPTLGELQVAGNTRRLRRMLSKGRAHLYSVTISRKGGCWYATVSGKAAELHYAHRTPTTRSTEPVGIDRGIHARAVVATADGTEIHRLQGGRVLETAQRRLRRANKARARTKPGSAGHAKAVRRLGRLHARIANLRSEETHQLTTALVRVHQVIGVEDLNVAGMTKNKRLARHLADQALADIDRQLRYKAKWRNVTVVDVDRWWPSSKRCSACGHVVAELDLSVRVYRCPACGHTADRDTNAAANCAQYAAAAVSTGAPPGVPLPA